MKKLILMLLTVLGVTNTRIAAQVSAYTFSQSLQTYGGANSGVYLGTRVQDDDVNSAVLPFGFQFNGTTYTTVNVCANGYLSFSTLTGSEYSAISDMSSSEVIAPFAQDMFMGTVITGDLTSGSNAIVNPSSLVNLCVGDTMMDLFFDFGGAKPVITAISGDTIFLDISSNNTVADQDLFFQNGSIRQETTGNTPNRVCEFEFRNMTRFPVYDESVNFKVRLYETSNKIEFLYGPMVAGISSSSSEVGLKGNNSGDYNSRKVGSSNTWSASAASSLITDACDFGPGTVPDQGLSYMWSPSLCVTPTLNVTTSKADICSGETVTLTASGAGTYSWSNGATAASISVTPAASTTYTLLGFNDGCSSSTLFVQQVTPQPTLTVTQTKSTICRGESSTLTVSGAAIYSWSNGSNSSFIVVSPSVTTNYTVSGSNSDCTSMTVISQKVSNCVGIEETDARTENVNAFPNPFTNNLSVQNPFQGTASLKLFDLLGNLVYQNEAEGQSRHSLNTEHLRTGLYVVVLEYGESRLTKKVIKQ